MNSQIKFINFNGKQSSYKDEELNIAETWALTINPIWFKDPTQIKKDMQLMHIRIEDVTSEFLTRRMYNSLVNNEYGYMSLVRSISPLTKRQEESNALYVRMIAEVTQNFNRAVKRYQILELESELEQNR